MRILLVSANWETISMPPLPLGLACVAAATQAAGHETEFLDLMFVPDPIARVRAAVAEVRPEVIGLSVRNIDDQHLESARFLLDSAREVVDACRAVSSAPIVLGGAGYSMFPLAVLNYLKADFGIQGDGETAFPALLEQLQRGVKNPQLPGLCRPGSEPTAASLHPVLDEYPLPEPRSWISAAAARAGAFIPVQSQRGCPMHCSYCSTSVIQGSSRRCRSPQPMVDWLRVLSEAGYNNIAFVDNNFNLPAEHAKGLCRAIVKAGLKLNLWCILYPHWVDGELVELLQQAGCREVSLGFESGCDSVLQGFNKRFHAAEVKTASDNFAASGIQRRGFLLLGGPDETRESVEVSLEFADSLGLQALSLTVGIRIYPHTALHRTAIGEGIVDPKDDLLKPRFYLKPGLRDWLQQRAADYRAARPWVQ